MDKLELYTSQLMMLKEMIENEIEMSSCGISEYDNVEMMQYYLDRAVVYHKVLDLLRT